MHDFIFAGRRWCALADRALFWPERRALLVADLHLEKASWFARAGQMLPPFDSHATLTRLVALADACDAQEVWALGDSFHDADGPARLDAEAIGLLGRLARGQDGAGRRVVWIAGNHDVAADLPGERLEEAEFGDLVLRHEALAGEERAEISGHYHPKFRVPTALRAVTRPCFVIGERKLILPAYGALTGGLHAWAPPIMALGGAGCAAMIATERRLLRYPLGMPARSVAR